MDPYKILGVKKKTPPDKVKEVYRKLAFQYHPDRNPDGLEKMKEINVAYQMIRG